MMRPSSSPTLHRNRRGISAHFPLLLLAAFTSSLLATLSVTRTLTSWSLDRRIRAVKEATRWRARIDDGVSLVDDDLVLSSHLAFFDDDDDGGTDETREGEGENDQQQHQQQHQQPPPPPAGACAPMEHTDYFGTPIVEGPDFVVASAEACCEACTNYKPRKRENRAEEEGRSGRGGGGAGEADPSLDCTLWVFCGDEERCGQAFGQCWLKHLAWPEASNPRTGADVPWTSGLRSGRLSPALEEEREEKEKKGEKRGREAKVERGPSSASPSALSPPPPLPPSRSRNRRSYHVAITASGPAVHWQSRVHYYWYLKQKRLCEDEARRANEEAATIEKSSVTDKTSMALVSSSSESSLHRHRCDMGGFTRVLHDPAGVPDDLSREIPTFVASPLPEGADGGYVVLNRPWAFVQWLSAARIDEEFVLMAEPDHLWLRPFQNPCPLDGSPAAFPFFYIEPSKAEYLPLVARALGKRTGTVAREEAEEIAPIGNSPTWMRTRDLAELAPLWMETSQRMFRDPDTRKAWGWVLEMYGFAVSLHGRKKGEERREEEAAVFAAAAAAARARKSLGAAEAAAARRGGEEGSPSSSSFPPLSREASEVALEARRAFRREQRRHKRGYNGGERGGGGGGGGEGGAGSAPVSAGGGGGRVRVLPRVMLQPPWDPKVTPGAALLHYTYGCDYAPNGTFLPGEKGQWRFDKREWSPPTGGELRELRGSAPAEVRKSAPATFRIVEMLLEAAEAIPGWERYAETGVAEEFWDGETFL